VDEAIAQHGPEGDGCWAGQACHDRRSYYRHRSRRQKAMRGRYLERIQGRESDVIPTEQVHRPLEPETLSIPTPAIPSAILITYAKKLVSSRQSDVVIHAIAAELWVGQARIMELDPVHTFGWSPKDVETYLAKVLSQFQQHYQAQYGNSSPHGFQRFAEHVQRHAEECPIGDCPVKRS
jgi:hypothetical protein